MRILWLTWKDRSNPLAGGAEVVNEELAKRLALEGHEVLFLVGGYGGTVEKEMRDGFQIIRLGGRYSVYWYAYRYYKKHLRGWADLVIDEVNTLPFFAKFYVKEKNVLFFHQLAREIWFYQMVFPLSIIGYVLEPLYLWLIRNTVAITISNSTKVDLLKYGFTAKNISIISEGIELKPLTTLTVVQKYASPTLLSIGSVRPMKRTLDIVKAFELAKQHVRDLQLVIAGDIGGSYGKDVLSYINDSTYNKDIQILGRITAEHKIDVMQKSHIVAVTSVKEGWGLIVTEANSQGTPAVVYNVDGLRDSVRDGSTGRVTLENTPQALSANVVELLQDRTLYNTLRQNAWEWSKTITFDESYADLKSILKI